MIGIYKITNKITKEIYIGQAVNIAIRFNQHRSFKDKNSLIDQAIHQYGKDNFTYEIIEECLHNELDEKEKYYINYYDCLYPKGYNKRHGGAGTYTSSQLVFSQNIITDLLDDKLSYHEIMKKYNISIQSLGAINNGRTYHNDSLSYPLRKVASKFNFTKNYCVDCGTEISSRATRCVNCMVKMNYTVERPTKEQLVQEIINLGFEGTGRKYGVSGNAIKKWCVAYNLPKFKNEIKEWAKNNLK